MPDEAILPAIEALDIEFLSWFDTVDPPELSRQNNLSLRRDGSPHKGKISSYMRRVKRVIHEMRGCGDEIFLRI